MTAYGVAHLRTPTNHPDVVEYMERIQATLDPFGGRFIVHGGPVDVLEGSWPGTLVVLEFPVREAAHAWYHSAAYQKILPLRTRHIDGDVVIIEGVGPDHDSAAFAARLRAEGPV
jgi:uncharacterized protein (DUF1330 family)